jgi:Cu+-exporting ATPase
LQPNIRMNKHVVQHQTTCYHCGEDCNDAISFADKQFCCDGCRMVYQMLNDHGMCDYYALNKQPGTNKKKPHRKDQFAFLEDGAIRQKLIQFKDDKQTHVKFYLPQIHCSSCLYLLENLHQLNKGVIRSIVDFARKEVQIIYSHSEISMQELAVLLTDIGYEPYISLHDLKQEKPGANRSLVIKLGVAGFCFGNLMLLSFPEYLGLDHNDQVLQPVFRLFNVLLSLPVIFFAAQPFFHAAWSGLRQKFLNIDAPIALAILVTFGRSLYEVATGTGAGYFDSMSGIVFFMLAGRVLQDKTYRELSFDRDFTAYFPIAVTIIKDGKEIPMALPDIKPGDTMLIHNEELIPADGILTRGKGAIDYSFVTGESAPVWKEVGEIVYAGGKQKGGNIEVYVVKEVVQSYLTQLWNQPGDKAPMVEKQSFVHLLSRYFTFVVFATALAAAAYWYFHDPSRIWNAVTAVLIVACPCALLLSHTFTNGNVLRILGRNHFYLKNAQTIEDIASIDHIVFDKTGTLTATGNILTTWKGRPLQRDEQQMVCALARSSTHPLSKAIVEYLGDPGQFECTLLEEEVGMGIRAKVNGKNIKLGSAAFTGATKIDEGSKVHLSINGAVYGYFSFTNPYRKEIADVTGKLARHFGLSVVSGDNDRERERLQKIFGKETSLLFGQMPSDKQRYVARLQQEGHKVMMIGDGLNDSGALKQSNAGVAIAETAHSFTPASDVILDASYLGKLPKLVRMCRLNKIVVMASFVLSILYNIIGLYFATSGTLSPMIAAILMPASSLSIVLLTFGSTNWIARGLKL